MTKQINPGLLQTSRRNVLRGTVLAGAAAMTGTTALATTRRMPTPRLNAPAARFIAAEAQAQVQAAPADLSGDTRVKQDLVAPPFAPVHEQVATGGPKIIEVYMETQERLLVIDEDTGASIWALTYNGSVPGPLILCHEGDMVELTLRNPADSQMEHNIGFHASTGGLGGGALTHIYPGEETVLRWKATKPGCFTYHCAPGGAMIAYHVTLGMNGGVMVLPRDGLKDPDDNPLWYDSIAYIGEQDFYLPKDELGDYGTYVVAGEDYADSMDAMRTLFPTHNVFCGAVGALTGVNALRAKVGETVLMIHNQANRDSRPHLIGGHGNFVWETGSFSDVPLTGIESWFVRGGSAMAATYTFERPGVYAYVNHYLIEAALLGATGMTFAPSMAETAVILPDGPALYVQKYELTVAEWNVCHAKGACTLSLHATGTPHRRRNARDGAVLQRRHRISDVDQRRHASGFPPADDSGMGIPGRRCFAGQT